MIQIEYLPPKEAKAAIVCHDNSKVTFLRGKNSIDRNRNTFLDHSRKNQILTFSGKHSDELAIFIRKTWKCSRAIKNGVVYTKEEEQNAPEVR